MIEIYGPESSGKPPSLSIYCQAQKNGGVAAFIDAETCLRSVLCPGLEGCGRLCWVLQPDTGEQALENLRSAGAQRRDRVIVVDSVAALVPRAEIEGEMGDSHVGLHARLMSQALRKLTGAISKSRTCVIFINQIREKVGIMFGNPETTTGGRALKFYASVRMEVKKQDVIKQGQISSATAQE